MHPSHHPRATKVFEDFARSVGELEEEGRVVESLASTIKSSPDGLTTPVPDEFAQTATSLSLGGTGGRQPLLHTADRGCWALPLVGWRWGSIHLSIEVEIPDGRNLIQTLNFMMV